MLVVDELQQAIAAALVEGLEPVGQQAIARAAHQYALDGDRLVSGQRQTKAFDRIGNETGGAIVVDGVKTTLPLFRRLIKEPDIQAGNYDIHWLEKFLEANKE